jgi:Raf kinase inhibitor-like YbhB/YbcL family protein
MGNKYYIFAWYSLIISALILAGCQTTTTIPTNYNELNQTKMKLSSPDFENNMPIPEKFTCEGSDTSPELHISEVPGETQSLALIMEDPDAPNGNWVHWVAWNIPPETEIIPANAGPKFAVQGNNSWPKAEYGGPCPPSGTHRYFFNLYALTRKLDLPAGSTRDELLKAMEGRIIDHVQLMGIYRKSGGGFSS